LLGLQDEVNKLQELGFGPDAEER